MDTFTAGSWIGFGWETFKKRPWFLIGVPVLAFIIVAAIGLILSELQKLGIALVVLAFFVNIYISIVYKMGSTNFALKAVADTASLKVMDYWHPRPFWKYLGASILTVLCGLAAFVGAAIIAGIIAGVGYLIGGTSAAGACFLVAFIVVAIIFALFVTLTLMFAPYIVIAEGSGPMKALKESMRITKGHRWMLLWFIILCLLLNVVGLICIIIGLFVTIPVTGLAVVHAYRSLSQKAGPSPITA